MKILVYLGKVSKPVIVGQPTKWWELLGKGKQPFLQSCVMCPYHYGRGCFIKIDLGCLLAFRFVGYHCFFSYFHKVFEVRRFLLKKARSRAWKNANFPIENAFLMWDTFWCVGNGKIRFSSVKTVKLLSRAVAIFYGQDRDFICSHAHPSSGRISAFLAPIAAGTQSALQFAQPMRFGHRRLCTSQTLCGEFLSWQR